MKNSQKFPVEWEAFQRCGSSKFISVEERFDPDLAEKNVYSQLLKNKNRQIIIDPETSEFTSNKTLKKPSVVTQTLTTPVSNALIKLDKDQLVEKIGSIYNFELNQLTNQIELDSKEIPGTYLNTFYIQLAELHKFDVSSQKATDTAIYLARKNSYHPVKNFLDTCNEPLPNQQWDNLAYHCFGLEDKNATTDLQRQLIAAIARIYDSPCKVDTALVLQSDQQGLGKGRFWEAIGGEWYSASLGDLRNIKEDRIILNSAWIHEWGEIDRVMGMQSSEQIKTFMSEQWDLIRYPYDKTSTRVNRKCVLVGTTNRRDFIKDPTGSRRFPIISPKFVNYDWTLKHRKNILASAKQAFNDGIRWWYDLDEIKVLNQIALAYAPEDPLKDDIQNYLDGYVKTFKRDTICIYQYLLSTSNDLEVDKKDIKLIRQISTRLQSLGWSKQNTRERFKLTTGDMTAATTIFRRTATWQPNCNMTAT